MRSRQRREPINTDLTALIDVVFLLIIFFLVTSVFKPKNQILGLSLPQTQAGKNKQAQKKQDSFVIELNESQVAANGKQTDLDGIESYFKALEKSKMIELRVAKSVDYERLVKILDLLKKNQLSNISLITLKADSSASK